jgi:hypothetical protein
MKIRLLVMNGQRLVQNEQEGQWATLKVSKAGALKPGIYNIHLAAPADKSQQYDGVAVYADKEHLYQQVGKSFIQHPLDSFSKLPEAGASINIKYDGNNALVAQAPIKLGRKLSR